MLYSTVWAASIVLYAGFAPDFLHELPEILDAAKATVLLKLRCFAPCKAPVPECRLIAKVVCVFLDFAKVFRRESRGLVLRQPPQSLLHTMSLCQLHVTVSMPHHKPFHIRRTSANSLILILSYQTPKSCQPSCNSKMMTGKWFN